ncbi:MAG: multicopper oxidase domain-containing protein [Nocardioides sp.]|nr:multicopper oxidase domain-containing protein [Nocardioides sp.]
MKSATTAAPTRGFWPMRDLPVVFWLLATIVVAVAHPVAPAPRWLLIHLTLLGAVTHAVFVWSRHFTDTLLHTARTAGDRPAQNRRLVLLDLGVLAVLLGVVADHWSLTVGGATAVVVAVGWHGWTLLRYLRAALTARFRVVVRYYVAAAALLPVGVALGALLARTQADPWHQRLLVAHAGINLLGWIGLTVTGTLVTLWPTMLRTRMASGAETVAARTLPVLLLGITLTTVGALLGQLLVATLGLAAYLGGLLMLSPPFIQAVRGRRPAAFATYSALAAVLWLVGSLTALVIGFATADSWAEAGGRFTWFTPFLAAGFGAQILSGALSYLLPVSLGGGGRAVAAANRMLDRWAVVRVTVVNAGLLVCVLPTPAAVRTLCWGLVLAGLATILPLLALAIRASLTVRRGAPPPAREVDRPAPPRPLGAAVTGLLLVALAATAGVAVGEDGLDLPGVAPPLSAGVAATGETTVVQVEARDMRFAPESIDVRAGNRLVIELSNTDDTEVHDLVLDDGQETSRLSPGESARLDVGVVGRSVDGWCSVIGHRRMGMTLTVNTTGTPERAAQPGEHDHAPAGDESAEVDPQAEPGPAFRAHPAELAPAPRRKVHRRTFHVRDMEREVAAGVTQKLWTFNGRAPGPTLRGRVGDRFVITLVNDASMGHSIDFHAGALAPDRPMRTIAPGDRLVYRFTARRAGIWMYHCSSMPMAAHIANGLFGAVIIDPPDLPPVDREFVLVQSELYLGAEGGEVDLDKLESEHPDLVVFNGYADQYDHRPLRARVGERVRVWVLDAGPNRATSFHVVGGQFATTYAEGAWLLRDPGGTGGSQSLALSAAQGGFVELTFPEAGPYPFISHLMVDAERGAHGIFDVTD